MSWRILASAACIVLRQIGLVKRYATHGSTLPGCEDIVSHYLTTEAEKAAVLLGEVDSLAASCRRHKLCEASALDLGDTLIKLFALAGQNLRDDSHTSKCLVGLLAHDPIKKLIHDVATSTHMPHIHNEHDRIQMTSFTFTELVEEGGLDCTFNEPALNGVILILSIRLRVRIRRNLDVYKKQRPQHHEIQAGDRIELAPSPDQSENSDVPHDENDETDGEL